MSVIVDVSHVGAAQAAPESSARRTVSRMTTGVVVFGYRSVSLELVVSPLSVTGVPLSCDHWYFAAPIEDVPSSVSGRFCSTVAPTGVMTAAAGFDGLAVTSTESVRVWPLPTTVGPLRFRSALRDGVERGAFRKVGRSRHAPAWLTGRG